jgi:hypothetical protein
VSEPSNAPVTTRCFEHYCPSCGARHLVAASAGPEAEYPRCCNRLMRYLGHVDGVPGRDESLVSPKKEAL